MAANEAHATDVSGGWWTASRLAWSVVALAFVLGATGMVFRISTGAGSSGHGSILDLLWLPIFAAWAIVGALVASKEPQNPIGWILCGLALLAGVDAITEGLIDVRAAAGSGSASWEAASEWLRNWGWIPLVFVPLAFLPVYFPDGRLPSRRWQLVPWCAGLG